MFIFIKNQKKMFKNLMKLLRKVGIVIYVLKKVVVFFSIISLLFNVSSLTVLPPLIPILLLVALFTLFERKILGGIQRRRGPNVVGI
jgi:NADH:ubiquinone oxidoreductase subunit H